MADRPGTPVLAVVGAGPCGLAVGIAARKAGIRCVLFDRDGVVSSIGRYPTFMTFFSTADRLELAGVPFICAGEKPTRREALRYYQRLVREFGLDVRQYEEVVDVTGHAGSFRVRTRRRDGTEHTLDATHVTIATGYFDHPNRLGIRGEELAKVSHSYAEGAPYFEQDCVVVGGGNSAVDAALELQRWGARVTLVHFASGLDPNVKPWVLPDISARLRTGEIAARFSTRLVEVRPRSVVLRSDSGDVEEIPNDWVLAMTGYTPDPALLRRVGVGFDEATGIPHHDGATMETDVAGVFIAGVIAAGNDANKVFIENGRDHGDRIVARLIEGGPTR